MRSPLAPLLGAVAIAIVAWAFVTPPFGVPDEAPHFAYVQSLVENGERPADVPSSGHFFSPEVRAGHGYARTTSALSDPLYKPAWEPDAVRTWRALGEDAPRDDIAGIGPQSSHPPLYYAYEALPYGAASGGSIFDRLFLMRLWSGLLMLATVGFVWLLVGELTRGDRLLQVAGAGCAGLQPMATFVSAGVNPDALLFASYSAALWLAARLLRRGASRGALAGLIAATAVAALTKASGLALAPALVLVLVMLVPRERRARAAVAAAAVGGGLVLVGSLATQRLSSRAPVDLSLESVRGFTTYLWDFYLPRLPFQHEYAALTLDNPGWTLWVKHPWGSFGSLEVQFPGGVYAVFAAVALVVLVAGLWAIARSRIDLDRRTGAALAVTALCLVVGIHWVDFQSVNDHGLRVIQGRYLLPLLPIAGVLVAAALSNVGQARRRLAVGLTLGGMAALQLASLAVAAGRWYA